MSTGGNVPTQGITVQQQAPKRGPRGELGKGTRSDRLKAGWRSAKKDSFKGSFREYVKSQAKLGVVDAQGWLTAKSGGTPEQKSARKARLKERRSTNATAKLARRKPKSGGSKKAA